MAIIIRTMLLATFRTPSLMSEHDVSFCLSREEEAPRGEPAIVYLCHPRENFREM